MQIRGKEIDFHIGRLEDAGRMELALQNMKKMEEEIRKNPPKQLSMTIKIIINMFQKFFRDTTSVDVLEGCTDLVEAEEVYKQFLKEIKLQRESVIGFSLNDFK